MKIEQIAFGCKNPEKVIQLLSALGLKNWICDVVIATGTIFGQPGTNKAHLYFNYDLGFELELLKYDNGLNWHEARDSNCYEGEPFLSHLGYHVSEKELSNVKAIMKIQNIPIIQEVFTNSHTNKAIKGRRKYHYVIFDTRSLYGFDLKLIKRIVLGE